MNSHLYLISFFILSIAIEIVAQDIFFSPSRLQYPVTGLLWVIETGDFNNDGNIDFVTASRLERSITLRLGNGDGTFNDSLNFPVGTSPRSLIPADFMEFRTGHRVCDKKRHTVKSDIKRILQRLKHLSFCLTRIPQRK